jgi:hypothetical protein
MVVMVVLVTTGNLLALTMLVVAVVVRLLVEL